MGNNCVGSRTSSKDGSHSTSFWWSRPTKKAASHAHKGETVSKNQNATEAVQHKAPQVMKFDKEEVKPAQSKETNNTKPSEPIRHVEETRLPAPPTTNKQKEERVRVGEPAKQNRPHNVKRLASAGLKTDCVLLRRTGNLREFYNLGPKLGQGQFGTTLLCIEKSTGKDYACKSIVKRKLLSEEDVEDVRREIQIMHHLAGSPNVISIKEAYEDNVAVHVVMELCAGGELFDRIVERGHYTERKAAKLARTIVGVIESCHSLGVMHRDLKPENFLFVNEQEDSPLKAIDFGLSAFFKPGLANRSIYSPLVQLSAIFNCLPSRLSHLSVFNSFCDANIQ